MVLLGVVATACSAHTLMHTHNHAVFRPEKITLSAGEKKINKFTSLLPPLPLSVCSSVVSLYELSAAELLESAAGL